MSKKEVDSYKLGNISVVISETDNPDKLHVECNDGEYRSEFPVRRYEYKNYKRHMNQKIVTAYKAQHEGQDSEGS
jgi:hypothetical protein